MRINVGDLLPINSHKRSHNFINLSNINGGQVGNGEERNCGDPTHNHTVHGGSFWAEAFYGILKDVRAGTPVSARHVHIQHCSEPFV